MTNLPSKPSHLSEQPKSSSFRSMIYGLLLVGAGLGIGKCVFDKKDTDQTNKPDITNIRKVSVEKHDNTRDVLRGWMPTASADELINLAQCRLLVLQLDNKIISEVEILNMADKIKKGSIKIDADGIIAQFCIYDSSDKKKIRDLIAKGFKLKKVEKRANGSWQMIFDSPLSDDEGYDEYLDLNERHVCKILTPDEEKDLEKTRKQNKENKELVESLKKGGVDDALNQFDTKKIMDEARMQGIENEEIIGELVKSIDKLKGLIKSTQNEMDKKKMICELLPSLLKLSVLTDKLGEHVKSRIEDNPNIPIDKFGNFLSALAESLGVDDFENCILYQAGITPEELMESSKQ